MSANNAQFFALPESSGKSGQVDDEEDVLYGSMIISNEMCLYCFDVLIAFLHNKNRPIKPNFPDDSFPLFVTWSIGREKRLRGCIGTFHPIPLHEGLSEYALKSAVEDTRFSPISSDELGRLHVSVSLLRHFEDAKNYLDWEIGIHGIRIEFFNEHGYKRTATFLPEVAPQQGWNHLQTIDSLLRKGGHRGTINQSMYESIKLTRYQSEKLSLSYQEYSQYRSL